MNYFDQLQKRPIIGGLVRAQNSSWYPVFFAAICALSGVSPKEIYYPCILLLVACTIFTCVCSKDMKPLLVPAFMIYYAIGFENEGKAVFDKTGLPLLLTCLFLLLAVLILRLVLTGTIREGLKKRGLFFWGLIIMDVALLCNGLFSEHWSIYTVFYGLLTAAVLTVGYCIFLAMLSESKDLPGYLCKTLVSMGLVVATQTIVVLARAYFAGAFTLTDLLFNEWSMIHRGELTLSWGLTTITGAVIATAIPAAFYLAKYHRYPVLSVGAALTMLTSVFFLNSRTALIAGAISFLVGTIMCWCGGKNKKTNRIITLTLVGAAATAIFVWLLRADAPLESLKSSLSSMRLDFLWRKGEEMNAASSGRIEIWKKGMEDFRSAPIFGVGFAYSGFYTPNQTPVGFVNFFNQMYHNLFVEILASLGIFGLLAFLIHLKHLVEVFLRKRSTKRSVILAISVVILGMSLLDNFFFYPNFAIVYVACLACGELMLEQKRRRQLDNVRRIKKGEKPRVLFPYVEAGKGHIVPEHTVCEAFRRKYGDRAEVVESKFFSETGNVNMQKTEKLFTKAVQQQNRSPVLSALCKIGNTIAGNTFALYVLLSMTISGRKTNPLAVEHMEELDAHVIYTTHWSIPYYVNQMKGAHPHTICFCPDVLSNGAFDVDCNDFLISGDKGYRRVVRNRMYAGGSVTKIPFPMREEIADYRSREKKLAIRKEMNIPEDEFVVLLCDGGYGMARMEKTVTHLLALGKPMTLIALCGTNDALFERLSTVQPPEGIRLIPVAFTDRVLEYLAASDLFVGKSGANSMAEPAALAIPIIVTKCITYIERGIKNYYVRDLRGALYIPSSLAAAKKIVHFSEHRDELKKYRDRLAAVQSDVYNAEATADLIWQRVCEISDAPLRKRRKKNKKSSKKKRSAKRK